MFSESGTSASSFATAVSRPVVSLTHLLLNRARELLIRRVHFGSPTSLMFSVMSSAIGRLKWPGHAEPSTRSEASLVPVIIAAPCATESPMAHSSLIFV